MANLVARLALAGFDAIAYAIEARAAGEHVDCEPAKRRLATLQRLLDEAKNAIAGIETGELTQSAARELCGCVDDDSPATLRGEDLQTVPYQEAPQA